MSDDWQTIDEVQNARYKLNGSGGITLEVSALNRTLDLSLAEWTKLLEGKPSVDYRAGESPNARFWRRVNVLLIDQDRNG